MENEIILRDYQKDVVNDSRKLFADGYKHLIIQVPTGGGKCLAKGTKILMYDGSFKKVEDLKPFDELMGVDSKKRIIKSTCQGKEEMYTVTPVNGESFTVNKSHILSFKISGSKEKFVYCSGKRYFGGDIANVELTEYLKSSKTFKNRAKIWRTKVDFSNQKKEQKINTYLLGFFLTDVNKDSKNYNCKASKELNEEFDKFNLFVYKHIPNIYKTGTYESRLWLLAGLLDSDGRLQNNRFNWKSISEKLCNDVMFLTRSLGFACYKSVKVTQLGNSGKTITYYHLNISGNLESIPTQWENKKAKANTQKKDVLVTDVKSITPIGVGDYFGFELYGKDRLFILSDFTVTHNTIIFSYISQQAIKKSKKVLIITDRNELLTQAGGTISKFNLNPSYIKAGVKFIDHRRDVYIAMSQTLRKRINKPDWVDWFNNDIDLVIIDECHCQEFNYLFESGVFDNKLVLGVTATPSRNGKMRQLGLDYERIVRGPSVKKLVNDNYLVNCDIYDFESPNMNGAKIDSKTGDYASRDMFSRFDKPKLYKGLINQYKKYTPNQKMIVFCCNVEHAISTCKEFDKEGISVKFIASDKGTPKKPKENATQGDIERYKERLRVYNIYKDNFKKFSSTRKNIIDGFADNQFKVLVNVDILTKGYDCPDIEVVSLYRATTSLTLYLQMIGRGSRISKGKTHFTVFDFGGNKERLGSYDNIINWSLWHPEKKGGDGVQALKECGIDSKGRPIKAGGSVEKGCKRLIMATVNICPFCGFKYPEKDEAKEIELKLASIIDENGVSLKVKSFSKMGYDELKKYRKIKKHTTAWLWRQLWLRGKEYEIRKYATWDNWNIGAVNRAISFCKGKF